MARRTPTRTMRGHLRWTRDGAVWADYLLTGLPYGFRPGKSKETARDMHTALVRALPGESLLLGVLAGTDPAAVVEQMIDGVDLDAHPDWVRECELTLDTLDQIRPGERLYWLSVPLGPARPADRALQPAAAAAGWLQDALALPRSAPSEDEVKRRLTQSDRIRRIIPACFEPIPATVAQMVWLQLHSVQRGLQSDLEFPAARQRDFLDALLTRNGAELCEPFLDEGGQTDLPALSLRKLNPLTRRYVKVCNGSGPTIDGETCASYQSMMVITGTPAGGAVFPGSEVIGRLDECGLPVDWAIRLRVVSSREVATKNQRALNNLAEQFRQREGEVSHGLHQLDRLADELAEYAGILTSDDLEVEAQATLILSVAANDPGSATAQAELLQTWLQGMDYRVTAPLGEQSELWWAMTPGVATHQTVRAHAQITTSAGLAALVPLTNVRLGDRRGSALALNITNGALVDENTPAAPTDVVQHDMEGATDREVSGSVAAVGELGSGKSFVMKKLVNDAIDRGAQAIMTDGTKMGEWVHWASAVSDVQVINLLDPEVSIDPLRLFGPAEASRAMQTFLTPLLNIAPTESEGVLLAEVLSADYLAAHSIANSGELVAHLSTNCELEGADDLVRRIKVFSRQDLGRAFFDNSLPACDLSKSSLVFWTHGLGLPSRDELTTEHLFRQLSLEKIFGRAVYAYIAALSRQVLFADRDRLGVFVVDEAHGVTVSPEGSREVELFIRDGRKHRASVILGTQDVDDLGDDVLRGLIPVRLIFRQRDEPLARKALAYVGLKPDSDDEEALELLLKNTSPVTADGVVPHRRGEAFMRDGAGNIGRIKVLAPARTDRRKAALTGGNDPLDAAA